MSGFYDILKKEAEPIWKRIYSHPFIIEISEGILPLDKFKFYIRQDHMFLKDFCKFLGMAVLKSQTFEQMNWFSELMNVTINGEMVMHKKLAELVGISDKEMLTSEPTPTMKAYTSYLLRVASIGSLGEILAAMSPCPCTYLDLSEKLMHSEGIRSSVVFKEWCSFYASEESKDMIEYHIDLLNRVAKEANADKKKRMNEHFLIASKYEYLFWDMAYNMESWPI